MFELAPGPRSALGAPGNMRQVSFPKTQGPIAVTNSEKEVR